MAAKPNEALQGDTTGIRAAAAVNPGAADVVLTRNSRAIYVGVSGNLAVQFVGDPDAGSVVLLNLAAGIWHPMQLQKILQTGTTATSVVVGY